MAHTFFLGETKALSWGQYSRMEIVWIFKPKILKFVSLFYPFMTIKMQARYLCFKSINFLINYICLLSHSIF